MIGTVHILDDDAAVLELTSRFLRKNGFSTVASSSTASALERFQEGGETVGVLIAEVTLSDGSGVDVALQLMALAPALKVVFVSGLSFEDWQSCDAEGFKRFPRGAVRFLQKPYSGRNLITTLAELLGEHLDASCACQTAEVEQGATEAGSVPDELAREAGLLDLAYDAIIVHKLNGEIRYWNHGAEALYGWSSNQAIGRTVYELLRTIFPEPLANIEVALLETGRWEGELQHSISDGSTVIVYSRWALRSTKGRFEVLEINRDISAQKKVEEGFQAINRELQLRVDELRRGETRFRALLESAPDAMVIVDGSDQMVLVNSQAEKEFGYTRDELLGQSVDMLVPERFRGRHPRHRAAYEANPYVRPMGQGLDLFGLRKNGEEFPVEISLSPLETTEGMVIISSIRDISERKRIEKALGDSRHALELISDILALNKIGGESRARATEHKE